MNVLTLFLLAFYILFCLIIYLSISYNKVQIVAYFLHILLIFKYS